MKILYIIPSFQHPNVRGPNRHYHLVRELAQRHRITLLALCRSEIGREAMEEVAAHVERIVSFDINGHSPSVAAPIAGRVPLAGRRIEQALRLRDGIKRMKAVFTDLVRQEPFDLIVFHGKSVFPVIEDHRELPIVIDFCDATSMRIWSNARHAGMVRRPLLWLRYLQVRSVERQLLKKTPHVAFISPRDRDAILPGPSGGLKSARGPAEILPNGVDHHYWKRSSPSSRRNCIVFTGVMDYAPNDDAAMFLIERVVPLVRQSVPDLEVLIVGRDPSAALKAKAARDPQITVTGFVDDVRPYLERAAVFAAPVRYASGTQNKVLEALAMELPVVTTSVVADGLRLDGAEDPPVLVADAETEFAERLVFLLKDEAERTRLAPMGRKYVEDHFIWSRSAEKLEQMCLAALAANAPPNKNNHPE